MGRFSCRFPSRCFAATVVWVVSVVDFRVVVVRQPLYGSFQLSISESLFCINRRMGRFSCRFPSRCFAATVVWVVSVVGFRVVVLRQPSYGSFQLSVSESLFCGYRRMGRFSCRFPSRCFAATVIWVVSVVDFRVVVLRQPSYVSFQLSISESLFCVNRRFSCRFPSCCFAATVVWVVSVVDFRVVVLRQPSYVSFQLSISESLFCVNRRFRCRFPSRCFAATVVWVVSVVDFRVVVLRQPSYGSFQLSVSESLFCGNRRMGRFSCRFPSRHFAATIVWVVSFVGFRVVVLRQPSYGSFQLLVSESLFCSNCRMGRFSCRFPSPGSWLMGARGTVVHKLLCFYDLTYLFCGLRYAAVSIITICGHVFSVPTYTSLIHTVPLTTSAFVFVTLVYHYHSFHLQRHLSHGSLYAKIRPFVRIGKVGIISKFLL